MGKSVNYTSCIYSLSLSTELRIQNRAMPLLSDRVSNRHHLLSRFHCNGQGSTSPDSRGLHYYGGNHFVCRVILKFKHIFENDQVSDLAFLIYFGRDLAKTKSVYWPESKNLLIAMICLLGFSLLMNLILIIASCLQNRCLLIVWLAYDAVALSASSVLTGLIVNIDPVPLIVTLVTGIPFWILVMVFQHQIPLYEPLE